MKQHVVNRSWTRWRATAALAFILLGTTAYAETVYGYVTRIDSPTEFDVGTLHVVMSKNAACVLDSVGIAQRPCNPKNFDVYSNVRLVGKVRTSDGAFVVNKLTIDDFALPPHQMNDGAILEENPTLSKSKRGWNGKIWVDGYPISVTPQTQMLPEPAGTTFIFPGAKAQARLHSQAIPQAIITAMLRENTCVVFHADRTPSGVIMATKLQFWPNWIDPKEKNYDKKFVVAIHLPDYSKDAPGTIQYHLNYA